MKPTCATPGSVVTEVITLRVCCISSSRCGNPSNKQLASSQFLSFGKYGSLNRSGLLSTVQTLVEVLRMANFLSRNSDESLAFIQLGRLSMVA